MRSRICHEARIFRVQTTLDLGDGIELPGGVYAGWTEWIETPMPTGILRSTKRVSLIELCAKDIRRFGGDVSNGTKALTFDITKQVQNGLVR